MLLILLSLFCGVAAVYHFFKQTNKNLPPGPRGLPLVGNVLSMGKHVEIQLGKWAEEFGDVMHVNMFNKLVIVLSDAKLIKEVFSQETFTGRQPDGYSLNVYGDGIDRGLIRSEGETWEQLRRFSLRQLRDFGFGKTSMEVLIMEEVQEILNWMKSVEGKKVGAIKEKMSLAVVNSLWTIVSGERLKHNDPALLSLTTGFTEAVVKASESGGLVLLFPWLRHIAPNKVGYTSMRKVMDNILEFLTKSVNNHKRTHAEDHSRDFIDVFLTEMNKKSGSNSESAFHGEEGRKNLVSVVADLFLAGSDTTSSTLDFAFIYLASFPQVQEKLQNEIKEVTGNSRFVSLADRPNMPYAESVLAEVLRCSSILPMALAHRTLAVTRIKDYDIPKDSIVLANTHCVHYKRKTWGDPENFRPERFLSPDEKTFKKHEALIPFSIGKRQCLGESLARDTLFLFITNVFQKFTVSHAQTKNIKSVMDIELADSIQPTPKSYEVVFKDRT